MKVTLGRIDQKLDDMKEYYEKEFKKIDAQFTKLNGQVQKNTQFRWKTIGAGALITLSIAILGIAQFIMR